MVEARPGVEAFVMGTTIYVLSQLWYDLLSMYVLQLQPVNYCKNPHTRPCTPRAAWSRQFGFALLLLLALALLERLMELLGRCPRLGRSAFRTRVYLPLAGMCVGWAFGGATVELISSLVVATPGFEVRIKIGFAVAVTLLSSSLILLLQTAFDALLLSLAACVALVQAARAHDGSDRDVRLYR